MAWGQTRTSGDHRGRDTARWGGTWRGLDPGAPSPAPAPAPPDVTGTATNGGTREDWAARPSTRRNWGAIQSRDRKGEEGGVREGLGGAGGSCTCRRHRNKGREARGPPRTLCQSLRNLYSSVVSWRTAQRRTPSRSSTLPSSHGTQHNEDNRQQCTDTMCRERRKQHARGTAPAPAPAPPRTLNADMASAWALPCRRGSAVDLSSGGRVSTCLRPTGRGDTPCPTTRHAATPRVAKESDQCIPPCRVNSPGTGGGGGKTTGGHLESSTNDTTHAPRQVPTPPSS